MLPEDEEKSENHQFIVIDYPSQNPVV